MINYGNKGICIKKNKRGGFIPLISNGLPLSPEKFARLIDNYLRYFYRGLTSHEKTQIFLTDCRKNAGKTRDYIAKRERIKCGVALKDGRGYRRNDLMTIPNLCRRQHSSHDRLAILNK